MRAPEPPAGARVLEGDAYPLLDNPGFREEILAYTRRWWPRNDVPSLCCDVHYEIFSRHLLDLGVRSVADIGCACGAQSLFFRGTRVAYTGIDACRPTGDFPDDPGGPGRAIPFLNEGVPGIRYALGRFPFDEASRVPADAAICNLSLGFDPPEIERRHGEIAEFLAGLYPRLCLYSTTRFLEALEPLYRVDSTLAYTRLGGFTPLLSLVRK
jgi:hypothetical protein